MATYSWNFENQTEVATLGLWDGVSAFDTIYKYDNPNIEFAALGANKTYSKAEFAAEVKNLTDWNSIVKRILSPTVSATTANVGSIEKTSTTIVASHAVGANTVFDATYTESTGNVIVLSHLLISVSIANFREILKTMQEMVDANENF
jgi:hypothetical protein